MKQCSVIAFLFFFIRSGCKHDDRAALVAGIKQFKAAVNTGDSARVAAFIPPKVAERSYVTSEEMIKQFYTLFKYVHVDELMKKDKVQDVEQIKGQPCRMRYMISIEEGKVTFSFLQDVNPSYILTKEDEEEGMDLSAYCEHMQWWEFEIGGQGIKAVSMTGAD